MVEIGRFKAYSAYTSILNERRASLPQLRRAEKAKRSRHSPGFARAD